jgi:hypothetical protein
VTSAAAAAAAAANQPVLPSWLGEDMLSYCSSTVLQCCAGSSTTPAAAAAAVSTGPGQPPVNPGGAGGIGPGQQQQQQQQVSLPRRPSFMPLPGSYQDLYLSLSEVTCGVCGRVPEHPAMCLVSGR